MTKPKRSHRLFYSLLLIIILFSLLLIILEQDLPDVETLNDVQLQVPLRVYSSDHKLIAEFGEMRRSPIALENVPPQLINAIIATEDKRYWEHSGIDILGLGRAAVQLFVTGRKTQGGSTITMQVARNFFLSSKKTYTRKIREILLAMKIDHELDKHKILGLYVNKVYLGYRAYGFSAAATVYYGKPLNQLTLAQLSMLAGLPKAPSTINPIVNPKAAKERRSHVLFNLYDQHYITKAQYEQAEKEPITASYHAPAATLNAPYVAEMVRDAMVKQYGEAAYSKGIVVTTTINSRMQTAANKAVHATIVNYSMRHGYRGPLDNISDLSAGQKKVNSMPTIGGLMPAIVTTVSAQSATATIRGGQQVTIPWQGMVWAGKELPNGWKGPAPKSASEVMKVGDIVYLNHTNNNEWWLLQVPQVQAALVSLNPVDGAVNAVVGGFDFHYSKFNRATDALRQAGSAFKPFVYSAAFSKGYTLASIINDAPIVTGAADSDSGIWRPQNDQRTFNGPTRLRVGLMRSLNLVSIRLLQLVGVPYTIDYINKMGFDPQSLPNNLTLALGVGDVTPIQLATGYAIFANGGYLVKPYFISKVVNSENNDQVLFEAAPAIACERCVDSESKSAVDQTNAVDSKKVTYASRVITAENAYQVTSAMQSVMQQGTGHAAKVLGRNDLAGKTGTTQDQRDAWFAGFNSDIVTVCWLGFDQPQSTHEYGAQGALPMWIDFMRQAMQGMPEHTMARPATIVSVKIDPTTGLLARPGQANAIFEIFPQQYVPTMTAPANTASQNDILTASPTKGASAATARKPATENDSEDGPVESDDGNPPPSADGNPPANADEGQPLF